jgi:two-component system, LytTR family, response regulator
VTDTDTAAGRPGLPPETNGYAPLLLVGEREHRLYVLDPEKIDYVDAHRNYVKYHAGGTGYIARDSLKRLAAALAPRGFVRIERSLLLNLRAVSYAQRVGRGSYAFTLLTGACLRSGASYRQAILRALPLAHPPAHGAARSS